MDNITLYYKQSSSDKVYRVAIEAKDERYVVNFAYGRRGTTLQTGTKTSEPETYDKARCIFDKLIEEKTAKGYTPGAEGTPYHGTENAGRATGIACQLLNPISETEVRRYIDDPDHWMQEKLDGRRLLIRKHGHEITGINRNGLAVGVPETVLAACLRIAGDFVIDGEAIGDHLHVFDLLEFAGTDLRSLPYRERYRTLSLTVFWVDPSLQRVDVSRTREEKLARFEWMRRAGKEGVVFKHVDSPYTVGRPASGGDQLKFKFVATASFIVAKVNGKRSVSLSLFEGDRAVSAGNVTIPANHDIPVPGAVVECRYLYAFRESGAIYQPVYLGPRDDILAEECVTAQLKYRGEEVE